MFAAVVCPLLATTARGAELVEDALTRASVLEAKLLQLEHAFDTWGCRRVELKTDALNEPARRSMESWGAVFEGIHRKHMLVRGEVRRDSAWYSVIDDDWPDVKAALERRLAANG